VSDLDFGTRGDDLCWACHTDYCGTRLGAVYEAGNFRMSTMLPMIWGGVNVMVLIVTSYPMQGGL
jgi:hypothetical protein